MNPPRKATVIDFLEWCRRNSHVRNLASISSEEFMELVERYEVSKGIEAISEPYSELRMKWQSAFDYHISQYPSVREALKNYPDS